MKLRMLAAGAAALGFLAMSGAANATVNVVPLGTDYVPRANMLDVRIGKILHFGSRRLSANFDIHNILNGSGILLQNDNFASWQTPQAIMDGRLFKLSASLDF